MRKFYVLAMTLIAALFSFSSCTKEGPSEEPQKYKEAIKSAVYESADLIKSVDNKDLLHVIDQLALIQNETVPEKMVQTARAFCETSNPMTLIRFAAVTPFDKLYGNYTYDNNSKKWIRTENKEAVIIKYTIDGKEAVWNLTPAKETMTCNIVIDNPVTGKPMIQESLTLPKGFKASISWNGKELLGAGAKMDISSDLKNGTVTLDAEAGGSKTSLMLKAAPELITLNTGLQISGKNVLTTAVKVNGNNMTDLQSVFFAAMGDDPAKLLNLFVGAKAEVKFMDQIVLNGSCKSMMEIAKAATSKETGASYAKALEAAFQSNIVLELKYSGSSEAVADIQIKAENDSIQVYIHFKSDNSSLTLEEYFDQAFVDDLTKQFEGLLLDTLQSIPNLIEYLSKMLQ